MKLGGGTVGMGPVVDCAGREGHVGTRAEFVPDLAMQQALGQDVKLSTDPGTERSWGDIGL